LVSKTFLSVDSLGIVIGLIYQRKYIQKVSISFNERDLDRIIEMAWEDRTPFDAIQLQFGISESQVINLMRKEMKPSSFKMWRERVHGRNTKHAEKRNFEEGRFKCSRQRTISNNKIAKR
jgi:uncharacterized protein (TIGR03643 family)